MPRTPFNLPETDLRVLKQLPVEIQNALVRLRQRRVTPKNIDKYTKQVHCTVASYLIPKVYIALIDLLASKRDRENIKLAAQILGILPAGQGFSVTNNIIQSQVAVPPSDAGGQYSYESVIRKLQDAPKPRTIDVHPAIEAPPG